MSNWLKLHYYPLQTQVGGMLFFGKFDVATKQCKNFENVLVFITYSVPHNILGKFKTISLKKGNFHYKFV